MRLAVFLLALIIAFPSSPSAPRQAEWESELRQADLDFCKQTEERRLEGWMDFFADDASILQNGKTVSGKAELRKFYEPIFSTRGFSLTWTPSRTESARDGSLGYTYGSYEARNGTDVAHGMYLTIWRRIDGHWKVIMDTGSALRQQPQ